ncbi:MAG: hypothetical protein JW809_02960 [Pirellulales bacterium]|nr:hypothetical protein [Pirellulales bacterium]
MTLDPQTHERLLELVYELLSETEAAELRARIQREPELAEAYAEARRSAELLAEGAKLAHSPIPLKCEPTHREISMSTSPRPAPAPSRPHGNGPTKKAPPRRTGGWLVGLAACALILLSGGAYWWHYDEVTQLASSQLRLVVTGPPRFEQGMTNRYAVWTTGATGRPMASQVELTLFGLGGNPILQQRDETDDDGRLDLTIPATLDVPDGARLEVLAVHQNKHERVDTRLAVEPARLATRLALDKPLYQPGETVFFRSLTLTRYGLAVEGEVPLRFTILDPAGAPVADAKRVGVTSHGVGNGAFSLPPEIAGGQYTLVAESPAFPKEKRSFFVRHYRLPRFKTELEFQRESYAPGETVVADFSALRADGPAAAGAKLFVYATVDGARVHEANPTTTSDGTWQVEFALPEKIERGDGQLVVRIDDGGNQETAAKTIPINLGKLDVRFYPEGGDLVAELESRVYFTARDLLGKPAELEGKLVDPNGTPIALVKTAREGMGQFSFRPKAGGTYRLEIDSPNVTEKPALPEVVPERFVVLTTGLGVFDAGAPLEFNVRAAKADLPLVAAATCRGANVGRQAFTTVKGPNAVSVALDEKADGVIRLTLYDYAASPPRPLAERLVYRRPSRQLNVRVESARPAFSPGEKVELSLVATDEEDRPVPEAVLGVAVVDDTLLNLADDKTPSMPTHFRLTTEVEKPEDLDDADFFLSSDPEAPAALDLLLGTQGWRRFAEKTVEELMKEGKKDERIARLVALGGTSEPPAVFDNLGKIRENYEAGMAEYRADRTWALRAISAVAFFGAVGLVILVAMLRLLGAAAGPRAWAPALAAATACTLVAALLNLPDRLGAGPTGAVAFQSFHVEPTAAELALAAGTLHGRGEARGSDYLYFARPDGRDKRLEELRQWGDVLDEALVEDGVRFRRLGRELGEAQGQKLDRAALVDAAEPLHQADLAGKFPMAERQLQMLAADRKILEAEVEALLMGDMDKKPLAYPDAETWARLYSRRFGKFTDADLAAYRFPVRQYAHERVAGEPGVRRDFAESLYWNPLLVCDERGKAQVQFALSDSVTTFRVSADAHAAEGRIGAGRGEVVSRIPFSLEPKLPLEVTAGDRIDLPLAVANDTPDALGVKIDFEADPIVALDGPAQRELELAANARRRETFKLNVVGQKGDCRLTLRGTAGTLADAIERRLRVVPPGFPKSQSFSGRIQGEQEVVVDLPESWVPGSLEVSLNAFPSTLANLQKGMDGILREPNGCFEQASTSNYPNVLSLQYMQEHDVADPALTRRGRDLLAKGYGKLVGYECKSQGYEWFGGDPGHEALTAYGLMEFRDMAGVYPVDRAMLDRTARWLLARRDGKGGFQRNEKALDSFGQAPADVTDAYITWALASSGQEGIEAEVTHAVSLAEKSDDPYLVALAASAALETGKKDDGRKLLDKLVALQDKDGRLVGTQGSITRSGGLSLAVETTALAALAWLEEPAYAAPAARAIDWIVKNREGAGGFGSTQGTILALKALVEHAKANRATLADGTLVVRREDKVIAERPFSAGQHETIAVDGLEAKLTPGANRILVSLSGENTMPYTLDVTYRASLPESQEDCPVRLATSLAASEVGSGETVALAAKLENVTDQGQPMTVAILGLPAGLEIRPDQLEDLKKAKTLDYYETRAREVICYWRSLGPKQTIEWKLDLVAAVPGHYTGPASRAYLYYTAENKHWADPLAVEIRE